MAKWDNGIIFMGIFRGYMLEHIQLLKIIGNTSDDDEHNAIRYIYAVWLGEKMDLN